MNLGLRDAIALGRALAEVVRGGPQTLLDEYSAARLPAARRVIRLAGGLTRLATLPPALRPVRNVALRLVSRVPAVRRAFAWRLAGLDDGPARRRPRDAASAITGPRRRSTPARPAR
jgi:2-polyprenyl-6-methoxyphenol hydroxylase-like FAD-dependent oxidoreductase